MSTRHTIESLDALRGVLGEPLSGASTKVTDFVTDEAREYVQRSPFLVLSTSDAAGRQDASPKGDAPGFVHVENDRLLVIPERPGNKLAYGLENILVNPHVGLLFMLPGTPETVRVNGRASISADPDLLGRLEARGKPAVLAIRVEVEECFHHCAKAFIRSKLWKPETWGERLKVSFGRMAVKQLKLDEGVADVLDAAIEKDYAENL